MASNGITKEMRKILRQFSSECAGVLPMGFRIDGIAARWCAVGVRVDMTEQAATSVVDFLDTKTPKEHLGIALAVLREFLTSHNHAEDMSASMVHWVKFDQFHEFLAHLVDGKDLRLDTIAYRAWVAENRPK